MRDSKTIRKPFWDDHAPVGATLPDGNKIGNRGNKQWAHTARGWYFTPDSWERETSVGSYLDYGEDHYRSGHEYCQDGDCKECQPGNVHACYYGPEGSGSRYFETVKEAREFIETRGGSHA